VGHYGGHGTKAAAMVHRVFHDERACLLCFVHVLYGKLLPRGTHGKNETSLIFFGR
jgi:hypothetical protein